MFSKKKKEKPIDKIDKLITWIVVWGVIASLFWVAKKTKKGKDITNKISGVGGGIARKSLGTFWKILSKVIDLIQKK